jgi:hypothetical protein
MKGVYSVQLMLDDIETLLSKLAELNEKLKKLQHVCDLEEARLLKVDPMRVKGDGNPILDEIPEAYSPPAYVVCLTCAKQTALNRRNMLCIECKKKIARGND